MLSKENRLKTTLTCISSPNNHFEPLGRKNCKIVIFLLNSRWLTHQEFNWHKLDSLSIRILVYKICWKFNCAFLTCSKFWKNISLALKILWGQNDRIVFYLLPKVFYEALLEFLKTCLNLRYSKAGYKIWAKCKM